MTTRPAAEALEAFAVREAVKALGMLSKKERKDTYVVSFYIYDDDDDPRSPTLTVGHNSEASLRSNLDCASGEEEARWNYAFWLQDELAVIGRSGVGLRLRDEFVAELLSDPPPTVDEFDDANPVTTAFVDLAVRVARTLHVDGHVVRLFGRGVLVAIHELEYYPQIAHQTAAANPPEVMADFAAWCGALDCRRLVV